MNRPYRHMAIHDSPLQTHDDSARIAQRITPSGRVEANRKAAG